MHFTKLNKRPLSIKPPLDFLEINKPPPPLFFFKKKKPPPPPVAS